MPLDPYVGHEFALLRLYGQLADELEETADLDRATQLRIRLDELDCVVDRLMIGVPTAHPGLGNSSITS